MYRENKGSDDSDQVCHCFRILGKVRFFSYDVAHFYYRVTLV